MIWLIWFFRVLKCWCKLSCKLMDTVWRMWCKRNTYRVLDLIIRIKIISDRYNERAWGRLCSLFTFKSKSNYFLPVAKLKRIKGFTQHKIILYSVSAPLMVKLNWKKFNLFYTSFFFFLLVPRYEERVREYIQKTIKKLTNKATKFKK